MTGRAGDGEPIPVVDGTGRLAERERYLALQIQGLPYDIGVQYGLLFAQFAF